MLKNILQSSAAIFCFLTINAPVNAANIEAFDMQRCVNMGNSLDAPKQAPWGKPIDINHFAMIKAKGFDTVRVPVRWSDYTGPAPEHKIEDDFMADVERIVDAALAQDLNVILNIHHFEEIMTDPEDNAAKQIAMWRQIATRFEPKSDSLWFEVLNEPNDQLNGKLMQVVQSASVMAIRESNPDRIVILGGEDWSSIRSLGSNIAPPDDNIVYTFHYYDPFEFTHQKAPWLGENMPKKKRGWGSKADQDQLQKAVETAANFRKAVQRPVFLGEFGAYEKIANKERVEFVGDVRAAMETVQIPWCLWSFSNTFALYDSDKDVWDDKMLDALVPFDERLETQVVTEETAMTTHENWGRFLSYYSGQTDFNKDVLTGVAVIKPGEEIHPPHKHIEEEFLMVIDGQGTWTIDDRDFPAKSGDILYAAPWDLHGLKNTGTEPLKFVVFKYNRK